MTRLLLALALFAGCQSGPTFSGVQSVKVQRVGGDGLHGVELGATAQRRAHDCLYTTTEVTEEAVGNELLLQDVYLIEIRDNAGIRSFELYTARHMKGNKGKYYLNDCIYKIIQNPI